MYVYVHILKVYILKNLIYIYTPMKQVPFCFASSFGSVRPNVWEFEVNYVHLCQVGEGCLPWLYACMYVYVHTVTGIVTNIRTHTYNNRVRHIFE